MSDPLRALAGSAGGHRSWANTSDVRARMEPAWRGQLARFEREVDPNGVLPVDERRRRAESARRAYLAALSLKAVKARQAKAKARRGGGDVDRAA